MLKRSVDTSLDFLGILPGGLSSAIRSQLGSRERQQLRDKCSLNKDAKVQVEST